LGEPNANSAQTTWVSANRSCGEREGGEKVGSRGKGKRREKEEGERELRNQLPRTAISRGATINMGSDSLSGRVPGRRQEEEDEERGAPKKGGTEREDIGLSNFSHYMHLELGEGIQLHHRFAARKLWGERREGSAIHF